MSKTDQTPDPEDRTFGYLYTRFQADVPEEVAAFEKAIAKAEKLGISKTRYVKLLVAKDVGVKLPEARRGRPRKEPVPDVSIPATPPRITRPRKAGGRGHDRDHGGRSPAKRPAAD